MAVQTRTMTPIDCFRTNHQTLDFKYDRPQENTVLHLQQLYENVIDHPGQSLGFLSRFASKRRTTSIPGIYLWGGVGRGKTYLMDLFFHCLPFADKKRTHFHRFMKKTHEQLKTLRHQADPLSVVAKRFASSTRLLCFDEFIVNDIGDAMILGGLLKHLFAHGVVLVATSNLPPDELYRNGLQRDRFQPAIDLLKARTRIVNIDGGIDYRLQFLDRANIYFSPLNHAAEAGILHNFDHIATEPWASGVILEIEGREIKTVRHATGVVCFDFDELCDGPRSQNDYIELAKCFHSILIANIPQLDDDSWDKARRLINLVDVFYDHNVKLIVSAAVLPQQLYLGLRLRDEFARTTSRLIEMQSHDYLARRHIT